MNQRERDEILNTVLKEVQELKERMNLMERHHKDRILGKNSFIHNNNHCQTITTEEGRQITVVGREH